MGNKSPKSLNFGAYGVSSAQDHVLPSIKQLTKPVNDRIPVNVSFYNPFDDMQWGGRGSSYYRANAIRERKFNGMIFMLDAADEGIRDDYFRLQTILYGVHNQKVPVLIFAVNQNKPGAMSVKELEAHLNLNGVKGRVYYIQPLNGTSLAGETSTVTDTAATTATTATTDATANSVKSSRYFFGNEPLSTTTSSIVPSAWVEAQITEGLNWLQYATLYQISPKSFPQFKGELEKYQLKDHDQTAAAQQLKELSANQQGGAANLDLLININDNVKQTLAVSAPSA